MAVPESAKSMSSVTTHSPLDVPESWAVGPLMIDTVGAEPEITWIAGAEPSCVPSAK